MTVENWLQQAVAKLVSSATPRLDAEVLACSVLKQSRAWVLSHTDHEISSVDIKTLNAFLTRRQQHEPIAYIVGRQEFFRREFVVNQRVLVPRPESETMIELALKYQKQLPKGKEARIADIGSGSGALGITLALEMNVSSVDFIDIDIHTLLVAKDNAKKHAINGQFHQSDLLESASGPYDIVLANLPYVPDTHTINSAAMIEPKIAIFGGEDGLDLYRKLFGQIDKFPWDPYLLLTESLPPQHDELLRVAQKSGFRLLDEQDFIQVFAP